MTLLRDGLKMGGAYFMADSLMKKHKGSPSPQPQQQQPIYVQQPPQYGQPIQYGQQPAYYGQQPVQYQYRQEPTPSRQQSGAYSRQIEAATPPPYSDDQSQQRSGDWVGQDGYLHAAYCVGTCEGRCNGLQSIRPVDNARTHSADSALETSANNVNRSQSSFQPARKS